MIERFVLNSKKLKIAINFNYANENFNFYQVRKEDFHFWLVLKLDDSFMRTNIIHYMSCLYKSL